MEHAATGMPGGRLLAISDIHGRQEGLLRLLQMAKYTPGKDCLILLGDFIEADRPSTWEILQTIRLLAKGGAVVIAGNHELKLAAMTRKGTSRYRPYVKWIAGLPLYAIVQPFLFVHAGIRPSVPLEAQSVRDLTEIRERFYTCPAEAFRFAPEDDERLWSRIVFGHTATHKLGAAAGTLWRDSLRIGIDTGAKQGMRLTLVDFTNELTYSCAANPQYRCSDYKLEPASELLTGH
ncbi:metallophosphoesterase [Paenibacillus sp. CAU 1782]